MVETVYDAFLEKLKARVEKIKVGPPTDPENYMGPVINAASKKSILEYIEIGKKEGRLITGGGEAPGPGHFLQPTVIADVPPKGRIAQEEIFGPVLAVIKAKNFDDALEIANNTEYGLTGAVYTKNRQKLEKAAEEFFVGQSLPQPQVHGGDGGRRIPSAGSTCRAPTRKPAAATTCCSSPRRRLLPKR